RACRPIEAPEGLAAALGAAPVEVVWDGFNYLARLASPDEVRALTPDMAALEALDCDGVIVTAQDGAEFDFISRYFAPAKGIPHAPAPAGAPGAPPPSGPGRLGRPESRASRAPRRGGEIGCSLRGERVELRGACVFYLEGEARY